MRNLRLLIRRGRGALVALGVSSLIVAGAVPASADPPTGVVPRQQDIVGFSEPITQGLCDQLSLNYNSNPGVTRRLYCWDALPPPGVVHPSEFTPKRGCRPILRSVAATVAALTSRAPGYHCIDFVMGAPVRSTAPSSLTYVEFARDAITWATRSAAHGGSDAPVSLTKAQLVGIFTCKTTNWHVVGGKNAAIKVYLPRPGSGTLATWQKFMGITTVGKCVSQAPVENEGEFAGFNSPNAVFIYSIAAFVAQKYHKNAFGSNVTGVLGIDKISGVSPITSAKVPTINPAFPAAFFRTIYTLVRDIGGRIDPIVSPIFGPKGYVCANAKAKTDIIDYGFLNDPHCGAMS